MFGPPLISFTASIMALPICPWQAVFLSFSLGYFSTMSAFAMHFSMSISANLATCSALNFRAEMFRSLILSAQGGQIFPTSSRLMLTFIIVSSVWTLASPLSLKHSCLSALQNAPGSSTLLATSEAMQRVLNPSDSPNLSHRAEIVPSGKFIYLPILTALRLENSIRLAHEGQISLICSSVTRTPSAECLFACTARSWAIAPSSVSWHPSVLPADLAIRH